ncbi:hypothetical protein GCM10007423_39520 [Dyadobacter endophyticus]|uniref:Uncharacterized protein n=1 Tax=Dyadobacter endophyticus TaxID=1749036 RepID=A0ABQ1Z040_9BACT|nr:hypothetical protein [Dyadobacter endophyticus]GGH42699.1 hypothetical protein GCM10007423_39520 [Dyadobacter endophyticus]
MTKVNNFTSQALSLADFTQDLYECLELPYEKDSIVRGNLITVTVETEHGDFKMSVAVRFDDTVESLKERFDALLAQEYDIIDSYQKWEADNYEHALVIQGRAFDSLTC